MSLDKVERSKSCPCNGGKILITEISPDHPYVRPSQTSYKGKIECDACKKEYVLKDVRSEKGRFIILKPLDESKEEIKLQQIDEYCSGLI